MRRCPSPKSGWPLFEAVDLQGKVGNQLFQIVVLPPEAFNLLMGDVTHRVPGETLFPRFHELLGPGIEDARLDPISPAEVTDGHLPAEPFLDDAGLIFRGVLPTGRGSDLLDERPGFPSRRLCGLASIYVVLRHFRLLSRCGSSIPCTRSPNPPSLSCFLPVKLNVFHYR